MSLGNRTIIKTHKAKKNYRCSICDCMIESGEHYQKASGQKEGKFFASNFCILERWKDIHEYMRKVRENL